MARFRISPLACAAALASFAWLTACSGGSGATEPSVVGSDSDAFAQQCSANNPYRADSDAGTNPVVGSLEIEKQWVRSYVNEVYLWYSQVPNISASGAAYSTDTLAGFYPSIANYFDDLTINGVTADRFSWSYPTKDYKQLTRNAVTFGYGMQLSVASTTVPRNYQVAYVDPNTPAFNAGVRRGDRIASIDGVSIDDDTAAGIAVLNAGLFPDSASSHSFTFARAGTGTVAATMTAGDITMTPVPTTSVFDVGSSRVGYILFNDFVLPAENQLATAIANLNGSGVNNLVIDLRYNGGGYVFIASELAYMVAGANRTAGKVFERSRYNDKRDAESNGVDARIPFFTNKCVPNANFTACTDTSALPVINNGNGLTGIYVLTTDDSCSASESVINGLRGIDVQVTVVGGTTCGKPYGMTARDNCGITYLPIEFQGVNEKGFGDYANGMAPTCPATDDLGHALGDPAEGMLATALEHIRTGICTTAFNKHTKTQARLGKLVKGPERTNKIQVVMPAR